MDIKVNITLSEISGRDLDHSVRLKDDLLAAALEGAGLTLLELDEKRWQRFMRFCHTGKFAG